MVLSNGCGVEGCLWCGVMVVVWRDVCSVE